MIDPLGLKGWFCQRPIGGQPGTKGPPLFNHQYFCVTEPKNPEEIICKGLTSNSSSTIKSTWDAEPRFTNPDEDRHHLTHANKMMMMKIFVMRDV